MNQGPRGEEQIRAPQDETRPHRTYLPGPHKMNQGPQEESGPHGMNQDPMIWTRALQDESGAPCQTFYVSFIFVSEFGPLLENMGHI